MKPTSFFATDVAMLVNNPAIVAAMTPENVPQRTASVVADTAKSLPDHG